MRNSSDKETIWRPLVKCCWVSILKCDLRWRSKVTLRYIFHALITPTSTLSVNMIVELQRASSKCTSNGMWPDGSDICNITLRSLTVKWMLHLLKKEKQMRCEFKRSREGKYAKENGINFKCIVLLHIGI